MTNLEKILSRAHVVGDTIIIHGKPGIGKSERVDEWAARNNIYLETLFLSLIDVSDLAGMPIVDENEKTIGYAEPPFIRRLKQAIAEGKEVAILLDELNRGLPDVRNSAMQLILTRTLNEHKIPLTKSGNKCMIIAAVNPTGNGYSTDKLDKAQNDRFTHLFLEANFKEFSSWGVKNNVHELVLSFLAENNHALHDDADNAEVFPTPRSWVAVSKYMVNGIDFSSKEFVEICEGRIGTYSHEFVHYCINNQKILKSSDVISKIETEWDDSIEYEDNANNIIPIIDDMFESQDPQSIGVILSNILFDALENRSGVTKFSCINIAARSSQIEISTSFVKDLKENDGEKFREWAIDKQSNHVFNRIHAA